MASIAQVGAIPVFIGAVPTTGNARCDDLEVSYSPDKIKAVMTAYVLVNLFEIATTLKFCLKYNVWLVEYSCDALGCSCSMPRDRG